MKDKIISYLMKPMRIEVATAAVIRKGKKIFLTKRTKVLPEGGKWCLPGGHVSKWERAEKTIKREVKEETGFDAENVKFLFVHEEFVKRLNLHAIVFVFEVKVKGNGRKGWEVKEQDFFDKKEVKNLKLAFTHDEILNKYWSKK